MSCIAYARRGAFLCLAGAASIFASSGSAQQGVATVEQLFLAAQQDQQRGLLDAAAEKYQTVLRLQPGIPEAYVNLGLVYYAQAKFAESAQALTAAARLRPNMRGVSLWLGVDDVKLNRPALGAALLREAVRQNPDDKLAQSWLGTALWDSGQIDAALLQLRKAAERFPDDPDFLFAAGEAYGKAVHQQTEALAEESAGTALSDRIYAASYIEQHEWARAEGHLRRAIQRAPRSVEARLELAQVFLVQSDLSQAQEQLAQALIAAPRSAAALARSGEALILMQQTAEGLSRIGAALAIDRSEALDALGLPVEAEIGSTDDSGSATQLAALCHRAIEKLAAAPGQDPPQQAALAALYARAGDYDAAMRAYRNLGKANSTPASSPSPFFTAMTAFHEHRYEEAETELMHWITAHPEDRAARWDLIVARRAIAMTYILRLLEVAPDSYHVHQLLGQLYADRDEDNKAIAEYLAVAAARPDLPGIHFWLGHLYWKHADADHALAELTKELRIDPGHPEANGELGAVLVAEGHADEAIPHLELAIHSRPDLWPAYVQLGMAYTSEKKYARAEEVLRQAIAHDADGSVHYRLAMVLRAEGKAEQAKKAFAEVKAIKDERMVRVPSDAGATADHGGNP
jgi:tetratricopeptide (TPR) repeat protein